MKITGTHNSITGESGRGLLSWLVTPFARTQRVGLAEQFARGARFFDLRVRLCDDGVWRGAHGLWTSDKSIDEVIDLLESMDERVWAEVTLERANENEAAFAAMVAQLRARCRNVCIRCANVKLPRWRMILKWDCEDCPWGILHTFKTLDGSTRQTLIPVPWLWHKVYGHGEAGDDCVNLYDFL